MNTTKTIPTLLFFVAMLVAMDQFLGHRAAVFTACFSGLWFVIAFVLLTRPPAIPEFHARSPLISAKLAKCDLPFQRTFFQIFTLWKKAAFSWNWGFEFFEQPIRLARHLVGRYRRVFWSLSSNRENFDLFVYHQSHESVSCLNRFGSSSDYFVLLSFFWVSPTLAWKSIVRRHSFAISILQALQSYNYY